ncbi:MAG: anaerobic ribonucleoside-triphosphate reductase activating protein [Clostridiales bacterium]|nr:anaerobic ribonucleoside-triphosphate reductase activating protein [Clostridiales bacterium]
MRIRLAGVVEESVTDGPGIRMVIFTQGCPHNCPGCHNPQTHDPNGGEWHDTEALLARFAARPQLAGLTISGGEPLMQAEAVAVLARGVKDLGKTVLLYSGYTFEDLRDSSKSDAAIERLLAYTDILIDGPFIEAERDISLAFRGSRNQRIIELGKQQVEDRI